MKINKTVLMTIMIASFAFVACKKETSKNGPATECGDHANDQTKLRHIKQKPYNLDSEQTEKAIKRLKDGMRDKNTLNATAKLVEADSLSLDSATWVLESALNFDYDQVYAEGCETENYTSSVTVPICINYNLSSDILEETYAIFKDRINAYVGEDTKVMVIDLEAFVDEAASEVTFSMDLQLMFIKLPTNCGDQNLPASPHRSALINCSSTPASDACTLINQRLACAVIPPSNCVHGYYYTNIYEPYPKPNPNGGSGTTPQNYAGVLFSSEGFFNNAGNSTSAGHCASSYVSLSASQINTYKAGIQSFATSLIPPTPANMSVISEKVNPKTNVATGSMSGYYSIFWEFTGKYGVRKCRAIPID